MTALEKSKSVGDSLCNLAIENGHPICVKNIEGHIAIPSTLWDTTNKRNHHPDQ